MSTLLLLCPCPQNQQGYLITDWALDGNACRIYPMGVSRDAHAYLPGNEEHHMTTLTHTPEPANVRSVGHTLVPSTVGKAILDTYARARIEPHAQSQAAEALYDGLMLADLLKGFPLPDSIDLDEEEGVLSLEWKQSVGISLLAVTAGGGTVSWSTRLEGACYAVLTEFNVGYGHSLPQEFLDILERMQEQSMSIVQVTEHEHEHGQVPVFLLSDAGHDLDDGLRLVIIHRSMGVFLDFDRQADAMSVRACWSCADMAGPDGMPAPTYSSSDNVSRVMESLLPEGVRLEDMQAHAVTPDIRGTHASTDALRAAGLARHLGVMAPSGFTAR